MSDSTTLGTFTADNLIAGDYPLKAVEITVISGQNISRGDVLGKITASGKYNLSLSGASDGSQTPDVIAAEDIDASAGDKTSLAYIKGEFNQNFITLGTAHTVASVKDGLKDKGIILRDSIATGGN